MDEVEERRFSLTFAAWKASRFLPKGRGRGEGGEAYGVFVRTFEKEVEVFAQQLAGGPSIAYRYMKENINRALGDDHDGGVAVAVMPCNETLGDSVDVERRLGNQIGRAHV